MPEYMLDTDTVSFALRGQGRVAARGARGSAATDTQR
jgi:hypothetical protein